MSFDSRKWHKSAVEPSGKGEQQRKMAGQRKLMSEIERTLKKVSEGVEVFNDIWDKVYAAPAQHQKEKHEADLKKEIKKLQRFRDQIKNWIGNSDVKDKRPLTDARKLIEQKMEEFKVCEKETKTKAYSKEGLAQIERLDPAEQARQNTRTWIQDCLTQLNEVIETNECDLERLQTAKGKNRNKQEMEGLEALLARHKWHILKLEQIIRLLDNDALEAGDVDELREDIEYYLEANQEPNFMDTYGDDDIYESLDLDSLGAAMQVVLPSEQDVGLDDSVAIDSAPSVAAASPSVPASRASSKTPKKSNSTGSSVITGIGRPGAVKPAELKTSTSMSTPVRNSSSSSAPSSAGLSVVTPSNKSVDSSPDDRSKVRGTPHRGSAKAALPPTPVKATQEADPPVNRSASTAGGSSSTSSTAASPNVNSDRSGDKTALTPPTAKPPTNRTSSSPGAAAASFASAATGGAQQQLQVSTSMERSASMSSNGSSASGGALPPLPTASSLLGRIGSAVSPPAMGNAGIPSADALPEFTEEQKQILRLIDESFHFIPESCDSEKPNRYVPRNVYPTPATFPTAPTALFENAAIFEKLDVDTLFFMFYYQQGSYQQYLAARELKRRTWGYHKKYKTWFKRHEEPQITGEDYEQGTFVYFDYETGWCQRIKSEFTFEYSYLEDELQ